MTETGTVMWFNNKRGFGYIKPDNMKGVGDKGDLFVHWQQIKVDGYKTLVAGQRVKFSIGANDKGPQAEEVEIVE